MAVYHHLTHALRIIRTVQPKHWPAALESELNKRRRARRQAMNRGE